MRKIFHAPNYIKDWLGWHRNADEIERIIEKSRENDYHVDEPPQYLDFRLGTLCNLRCRMCQSQNSSAIYKELKDDELYTQEERDFVVKHTHWNDFSDYTQPWFDTPEFLESVEEWLPNVNRLYFTGGEPTIIQRTYWILEKCVELGIAKDIDLVFNSNMTNIQPRFLDLLAKFRDVLMCLSRDQNISIHQSPLGSKTTGAEDVPGVALPHHAGCNDENTGRGTNPDLAATRSCHLIW